MATTRSRFGYIDGNTARRLRPQEEYRTPRKVAGQRRRKKAIGTKMDLGFILFLTLAMAVTGFTCIQYIRLQSEVTTYVDEISQLEIQYEELRAENDDMESRVKGTVGLEDIKKRAMNELGMTYAREDQIVVYESDGTDYVRQFVPIEE